ncbi:MAG: hypothetical protein K2J74_06505, partial [Muribaculaceae bacterium]|nr:hypothetical protein [Muribaculaceae bacterium]
VIYNFVVSKGVQQLRWHLSYVIFWGTSLSAISFFFLRFSNEFLNIAKIVYASLWSFIAEFGIFITTLTFDSVYCETDKYIMKKPGELIGFDSAILYEKKGLFEIKKNRYQGVYPKTMIPLDSIGAIVVSGKFFLGGPEWEESTEIFPIDNTFDKKKAEEYAKKHNIWIGNYN